MSIQTQKPLPLLGGLSAQEFMQEYWQRKPLLVRQAIPGFVPPVVPDDLHRLAGQEGVESRLIQGQGTDWSMKRGPFSKRSIPARTTPNWTLLVQGVDLHDEAAHALLQQFSFVPQARLDDLMISFATDGGGVGPHFDSYDVFLLQAQGQRRWRIGAQENLELQEGVPLKILKHFEPEFDWVLEPGDMLYLPPRYAHDGIAIGDCMTYSIGFRVPNENELAQSVLEKVVEELYEDDECAAAPVLYQDAGQAAVSQSGRIPSELQTFAAQSVAKALEKSHVIEQALGEYLTELKSNVFFQDEDAQAPAGYEDDNCVRLNKKTRMMYDDHFLYINGESYRCEGNDAAILHAIADARQIDKAQFEALSEDAQEIFYEWQSQGWLFFSWGE